MDGQVISLHLKGVSDKAAPFPLHLFTLCGNISGKN